MNLLKYFTYEFKKSASSGKLYLLPKIHKKLLNKMVKNKMVKKISIMVDIFW